MSSAENFTKSANTVLLLTVSRRYLYSRTSFSRSVFRVVVSSHCTFIRYPWRQSCVTVTILLNIIVFIPLHDATAVEHLIAPLSLYS